jgi:hypothetical protein
MLLGVQIDLIRGLLAESEKASQLISKFSKGLQQTPVHVVSIHRCFHNYIVSRHIKMHKQGRAGGGRSR